jgi:hypothetical protein
MLRFPEPVPEGLDKGPWDEQKARDLVRWMRSVLEGLGGLQGTPSTPSQIQAGVASTPGTSQSAAPSDHVHSVQTAAPSVKVTYDQTAQEGSGAALMRADARLRLADGVTPGDTLVWDGAKWVSTAGGGGAPSNASYITRVPEAGLSNEQALSILASGIMLNTTGTGVVSVLAFPGGTTLFLRADGTFSAPGGGGTISQVTVDFGPSGVSEALFTIPDASVTPASKIIAQPAAVAPPGKDLDEVELETLVVFAAPSTMGAGFLDLFIRTFDGSTVSDKFVINYQVA